MSSFLNAVDFPLTIGPALIELPVGLLLTGIMVAQLFFYWDQYKSDPGWMKALVYTVCGLEMLQSALFLYTLWFYFVLSVSNPLNILATPWTAGIILFLEMMIAALAQGFNIYRIWQLSNRYFVTIFAAFMLFCRCALGIATGALSYKYTQIIAFSNTPGLSHTTNAGLAMAVIVDFLVAALMIYYLHKQRSGFKRTQHIVHVLMLYTVNTGALTMMFSLLALLTFNCVKQTSTMSISFAIMVTKLYANSLLAMLNARRRIRNVDSDVMMSIPMRQRGTAQGQSQIVALEEGVHIEITREAFPGRSSTDPSEISKKEAYSLS